MCVFAFYVTVGCDMRLHQIFRMQWTVMREPVVIDTETYWANIQLDECEFFNQEYHIACVWRYHKSCDYHRYIKWRFIYFFFCISPLTQYTRIRLPIALMKSFFSCLYCIHQRTWIKFSIGHSFRSKRNCTKSFYAIQFDRNWDHVLWFM